MGGEHRFYGGQIYFKMGGIIACLYTDGTVHNRGNVEMLERMNDGKSKAFE